MKLSQFKFELPPELIANHPPENRDGGRLMVINRKTKKIEHKKFVDILKYFSTGDVFVINNTKSTTVFITYKLLSFLSS